MEVSYGLHRCTALILTMFRFYIANGTVPVAPVMHPPLPSAGSQYNENRRASNGFIWVEDLANTLNSKLLNVSYPFACIFVLLILTWRCRTRSSVSMPGEVR